MQAYELLSIGTRFAACGLALEDQTGVWFHKVLEEVYNDFIYANEECFNSTKISPLNEKQSSLYALY